MGDKRSKNTGFRGIEVVTFESRRAREMATLIARQGGVPIVAPAMREVPREENSAAFAFAEKLLAGQLDAIIFMTGVGTRRLVEILETRYSGETIIPKLASLTVVARGPKPAHVLRELKVPITIMVPEPNTWREILQELDDSPRGITLRGSRIAVQEYGAPNELFVEELEARGVEVLRVPVYQWALPEDLAPLRAALVRLVEGRVGVTLFTTATQVEHVLKVAALAGISDQVLKALCECVVCSVGPTCTEALVAHGIAVDLEPEHPKMGALVHEAAEHAAEILEKKKSGSRRQESGDRSQRTEATWVRAGIADVVSLVETPRQGSAPPDQTADPWRDSLFMKACRREPVEATPVWLMRQAGRYMKEYRDLRARVPFLELCKNPALVSEVTVTAARKLGVDAAIIFADLLLIVEPLGYQLEYDRGEGPVIKPGWRSSADIDRLREVEPQESLAYFFEAIRRTRADLDPRIPLIGFAGAPFTMASYLIEGGASRNFKLTKISMYRDPGAWRALMEHLARNLIKYVNCQIAAGVQAVQIFDTWVGCLGPADYREFVLPYTRTLMQGITPGTPVIHFGTGTGAFLEDMRDAGGHIMGIDSHVELDDAWRRLGDGVGIQGNLDPMVLFAERPFIRGRVERILQQAAGRSGHIFNLGHGILPDTPFENVTALVEMVHELSAASREVR